MMKKMALMMGSEWESYANTLIRNLCLATLDSRINIAPEQYTGYEK